MNDELHFDPNKQDEALARLEELIGGVLTGNARKTQPVQGIDMVFGLELEVAFGKSPDAAVQRVKEWIVSQHLDECFYAKKVMRGPDVKQFRLAVQLDVNGEFIRRSRMELAAQTALLSLIGPSGDFTLVQGGD